MIDGPDGRRVISGSADVDDSYDMELTAILEAVRAAEGPLTVVSDHRGIVDGLNRGDRPCKCREMWDELYAALEAVPWDVRLVWEKGEQTEQHRLAHRSARQAAEPTGRDR